MIRKLLLMIGLILMSSPASAFDDSRSGFSMGFGLGGGVTLYEEQRYGYEPTGDRGSQTTASVLTNFEIGVGVNQRLLIQYTNFASWFGTRHTYVGGIGSIGGTYFFSSEAAAGLIEAGFGLGTLAAPFNSAIGSDTGLGAWAGVGYEFARHWIARGRVGYLNPPEDVAIETEGGIAVVGIFITYLGY